MTRPGHNQRLGAAGEDAALAWYESQGYSLQARNWRAGRVGELDLICSKDRTVVFVEVKARSSNRFGSGLEAVTTKKQHTIRRVAMAWLATTSHPYFAVTRFDVVSIEQGRLTVVESAF